jgi:predicted nuclease of predicted toxin-antitoxin system
MTLWLDAQLSPAIAAWISQKYSVPAVAVRDLGLRDAKDRQIFQAAREANAVVLTKDVDFVHLIKQYGPPPQVIFLTCGNTSNSQLREILERTFVQTMQWIAKGEPVVEITAV